MTTDPASTGDAPRRRPGPVHRSHGMRPASVSHRSEQDSLPVDVAVSAEPREHADVELPEDLPPPAVASSIAEDGDSDGRPSGGFPVGALTTVFAGALSVTGCLLPWVSITVPFLGTVSYDATRGGYGTLALVLSILVVLIGCARFLPHGSLTLRALAGPLGAGVLALGAMLLIRSSDLVADMPTGFPGAVGLGPGLWVLVIGGGVGIISALLDRV